MKQFNLIFFIVLLLFTTIELAGSDDKTKCNQGDQKKNFGQAENSFLGRNEILTSAKIGVTVSRDPNEIIGLKGYDTLKWVSINDQLAYTIYFENDPDFATAAAQKVIVRYAFHEKADVYSLGLGSFGFGSFVFTVEGYPSVYQKRLDLRDSLGIYVDVVAGLDVIKKEAFWVFQSIDPETGLPPLAVHSGFLPVNDKKKHNGEGFVNFVMKPKTNCLTRDTISAKASIVFDTNEAISTNVWVNTLDAGAPVSKLIATVDANDNTKYHFSFDAEDDKDGSGVKQVTLYLSRNKEAWLEYAVCAPDSVLSFTSETGTEYAFYSLAEDNTGNIEAPKTQSDFVINSNTAPTDMVLSNNLFNDDIAADGFIGELSTVDSEQGQTFIYALAEGEGAIHNDLFSVSGNSLLAKNVFKCAADSVFKIRLSTTDVGGLSFKKSFELKLNHVLVKPKPDTISVTICERTNYQFHGTNYNKTGTYTFIKENKFSCDSIYVLDLRLNPYPAQPTITIDGNATLGSSAVNGNQWYDSEGKITGESSQTFTPSQTGTYYVTVTNGSCESVPSVSYFVNLSDQMELSWDFAEGWNWISSNLSDQNLQNPKQFLDPVKTNVKKLLGQNNELVNDPVYGLTGGLTAMGPQSSYKLNMKLADKLVLSGNPYDPEVITVNLNKGWNWTGYIPTVELATEVALSNLKAEANDVIKGLSSFSIFDGSKWTGTLTKLVPGEGYMYFSASTKNYKYSSVKATPFFESQQKSASVSNRHWTLNERQYPNNMSIVARLYSNESIVEPGIYTIGAFVGNECRGIGEYVDGLLFITIHGNLSGETISFKALENATEQELPIKESTGFGELVLGNPSQPYKLNLTSGITGIENYELSLTVYPNPVKDRLYIGGNLSVDRGVKVLNMSGSVLLKVDEYSKANGLDVSALPNAVYLIAVSSEKGTFYRKFVKSGSAAK